MSGEDGGFIPDGNDNSREAEEDDPVLLPMSLNKKCRYCSQIPVDGEIEKVFGILVCKGCRYKVLKFITKTSCLSTYLLTNEELRDFNFLVRPNPHKGTWSDMNLYLEDEVEEFAIRKWGSLDKIREVREERSRALENRKIKRLRNKIMDLRRKTRIAPKVTEKHIHEFVADGDVCRCKCGLAVEQEEF